MNRWTILAVLFSVRAAMGISFQAVPALMPLLERDLGLAVADLGLLIGLFHIPGILLALPSGRLGARFGEKPVVLAGLLLMAIGLVVMATVPVWSAQLAGRLLAGVGGVLLNVVMTKMAADWFAGREIATAMAILANAWPGGIAIALFALPPISGTLGLQGALMAGAVYAILGLLLLWLAYRPPGAVVAVARGEAPRGLTLGALLVAGAIWGLYNLALGMIFAFGPTLLVERGATLVASGQTTGVLMLLAAVSVAVGGILSDRSGRPDVVILVGTSVMAVLLALAARSTGAPMLLLLGLWSGLPAGAILSLPTRVLTPVTRAIGMGLFFTMFYVAVGIGPIPAGYIARAAGTTAATFDFGAALLITCMPLLLLFHALAARAQAALRPA